MNRAFLNPAAVRAIIRREYVTRVRTKSFVIMTLLLPTFMAASIFLPLLFRRSDRPEQRRIALADGTGILADSIRAALDELLSDGRPRYVFDTVSPDSVAVREARELVRMNGYDALLVIPETVLDEGTPTFSTAGTPSFAEVQRIEGVLSSQVVSLRLSRNGLDPRLVRTLTKGVHLRAISLSSTGEGTSAGVAVAGTIIMAMLMYMTLVLYGGWTMLGVLRDKTSRVVEILVSTTRPTELMMGKIVGIGSVGLTQIGIWLTALVVSGVAAPETMVGTYLHSLDARSLIAFILFYVSGYLLFATLYAGVGAMCSSMEDAQQLQWPVVFLLMMPILMVGPAVEDPGRPLVVILSFVPYFSPVLMLLRISAGQAGLPEMLIALTLNAATIILTAWLVGRAFRVGILMTGKRPALREIWRWMMRA